MSTDAAALQPHARSHRLTGVLFASAGAVAFSGKAIVVKLAYRYGVDAVTLIMYRMLFAMPLFIALSFWSARGKPALTRADWRLLIALGVTGYYASSFLDFSGLQYIGANLERLILYLNPTFVLALSGLLFGAKVLPRQWVALGVSYLGVLVVFGHDLMTSGAHIARGSALVLGSAFCYALYLVFSGQAVKRLGPLRITGVATSVAAIVCIGQFFVLRPVSAMMVAPQVIWLSILNATLCTFVPVVLVMMAVERVGAPMVAQTGNIGPLSTIFLSILVLHEPFTMWLAVGTVLVLAGIWLLARTPQRAATSCSRRSSTRGQPPDIAS